MLKNIWKKATLTTFAVVAFTLSGQAQEGKTESDIQAIMQQHDMVGLSVAVVKKGEIIYAKSFGLKDVESQAPLTNNDIFRIASISKSFTVTA
ncbi:beta-lactamase [Pontibacter sp. BAB1700]|nr:beta-lactamase [Pontibacter sp. BAB1700]